MKILRVLPLLFVLLCAMQPAHAQDFMLQGWYWDYPGTANGHVWADTLANKAQELKNAGFTYVWLPPLSRASFGSTSNGYDPKDLFDLGEFGGGPTRFGTRTDVNDLMTAFNTQGLKMVGDMIYNHRDGGKAEDNPSVEGWIENMNATKITNGDQPYPSDRYRSYLPIGGATGRGTGTYYFKFKSASEHSNFYGKPYKVYMQTNTVGFQGLPAQNESEPNGGGGCGEANNTITLGIDMQANIDGAGCKIDEFALTIGAGQYNAAGDTVWIYTSNSSGYTDHYVQEVWYSGTNHQSAIKYQTFTNFFGMPSGRGGMNHTCFKPNGSATCLCGDWDYMYFFYDYDQFSTATRDTLFAWSRWMWSNVGMRGLRMDAVKHFTPQFVGDLLDNMHANAMDPGMVVGEWFDSNSFILKDWVDDVKSYMDAGTLAAIKPRVFDFALRDALEKACDSFGYDARNVFNSSIVDAQGVSGDYAVTFVNNHDFRDPGQPVDNQPILAYAYTLTNNQLGVASVFYPDYYNAGLKTKINQLIEIHKNYCYGATSRDYLSRFSTPYSATYTTGYPNTTLLYQLRGAAAGRDVIVAINFAGEALNVTHGVNTTDLPNGATLVDVTGNATSATLTVSGGQVIVQVPSRSYAVFVEDGGAWNQASVSGFGASTYTFNEVDMLDKDTGYAVASSGKIAKTTNGGLAWNALTSGTTSTLSGVKAVDANTVVVVGASNTIRRSTNGGTSWTSVAPSMSPTPTWRGIEGVGNTLYAVGEVSSGSRRVRVVRSTNGGASWTRIDNGTLGSSGTSATAFYGVDAVTADLVYICGTYATGGNSIYRTTNGTAGTPTWSGLSTVTPFYSIEMIDASWGYVVGSASKYYQTTNGTSFSTVSGSGLAASMAVEDVSWNANTKRLYVAGHTGSSGSYVPRIYRTGVMTSSASSDVVTAMTVNLPANTRLYAVDAATSAATATGDANRLGYYGGLGAVKASASLFDEEETASELITSYELFNNYPNPFNPTTTISYQIPEAGRVSLRIYNMLGQLVRTLVDREVVAGKHSIVWDGRNERGEFVATGVYLYRMEVAGVVRTKKLVLAK